MIHISLEKSWYPITEVELLAYFGTILLSGLVQMKSWEEYFSLDPYTHYEPITSVFSTKRWFLIKRFLHFDNVETNSTNKLGKIWTVYQKLQENFRFYWRPYQRVTIDEGIINTTF